MEEITVEQVRKIRELLDSGTGLYTELVQATGLYWDTVHWVVQKLNEHPRPTDEEIAKFYVTA